jgi:uncharacterized iron-regulated membrane protein
MNTTQDTPEIALPKKAITQELTRTLKERLAVLRRSWPELSFDQLWERLKAQEPDLFAQAKRIEDNDWGTGNGSIKAASGDYISNSLPVQRRAATERSNSPVTIGKVSAWRN